MILRQGATAAAAVLKCGKAIQFGKRRRQIGESPLSGALTKSALHGIVMNVFDGGQHRIFGL
jgi:hypothetical protein